MSKLTTENAVAVRTLEVSGNPGKQVEVRIGKPEEIGNDEWVCHYRIVGDDIDINQQINGIDAVQALQLVFKVIDSTIIGAELSLLWNGQADLGFVPT